ncbi:hypothetical protein VP1G_10708 [Cytospora mali]|uniref:Uncharacterized protein n=1 Tax=Cytospora mali TaxID=578113 RepID=A0A194UTJ5_CYTMA|nr:hypothetical protein VP1G_10708 [Valsa mali var. pyri (nom. inval.)]
MVKIGPQYGPYPCAVPTKTTNNVEDSETNTLVDESVQKTSLSRTVKFDISSAPKTKRNKTIYEAWSIVRYAPSRRSSQYLILGMIPWIVKCRDRTTSIVVTPENCHSQDELETMYSESRKEYLYSPISKIKRQSNLLEYEDNLDKRVRDLEVDVLLRIHSLVRARTTANSSTEHRREYKIVCLREVADAENLTSTENVEIEHVWYRPWGWRKRRITEYQVILQGVETKETKERWACNTEHSKSELWKHSRTTRERSLSSQ